MASSRPSTSSTKETTRAGGSPSPSSSGSGSEDIDIFSDNFNPLKVLYSPKFPLEPGPIADNVENLVASLDQTTQERSLDKAKKTAKPRDVEPRPCLQRNFQPEQMAVQGQQRNVKNVLTYMTKQETGPMARLRECVDQGIRLKVVTRNANKIRGTCIGTLVAFDKHWNLALVDVDEEYIRKRHQKTPIGWEETETTATASFKTEQIGTSTVRVVKCRRQTQLCQRHVPQVVLRGEHVAYVSLLN